MPRPIKYNRDNDAERKREAVREYKKRNNIVRVPLDMPREEADKLREYCSAHDLTVAGFIRQLIRDAIAGSAAPDLAPRRDPQGENRGSPRGPSCPSE